MLRRAVFVGTDFSEEHIASIIRVTRISEVGTTLAVTSNRSTLRRYNINMYPHFALGSEHIPQEPESIPVWMRDRMNMKPHLEYPAE
jgi:hypothetical protein